MSDVQRVREYINYINNDSKVNVLCGAVLGRSAVVGGLMPDA